MKSRRRLLAMAAMAALAFTACPGDDDIDEVEEDPIEETQNGGSAGAAAKPVKIESYGSCHDRTTAGGNSDGELVLTMDMDALEVNEGAQVSVTMSSTLPDGTEGEPVTATGLLDAAGKVTLVIPLSQIGETLTVTSISVEGHGEIDLDAEVDGGLEFEVAEESVCLE